MKRKIVYKELFSEGKSDKSNEDDIYAGENFAAVIDGVSHKSSVLVNGRKVRIAEIIVEAIKKMDRPDAPVYAKTLSFEETVKFINLYIEEYLRKHGMEDLIGKMEATGVIYSKYHNQAWIVGDCRMIYDGNIVKNPLEIDQVYIDIRIKLIEALMKEGYTEEELLEHDISRDIIKYPELLEKYIKSDELKKQLEEFRIQRIKTALLACGFSEEEIIEQGLVQKYYDPRVLQQVLKNNPNMKSFGYAVFNGRNTELKNCKVVNLPEDVKEIKLFSDGFPIETFEHNSDIGTAVRTIRKRASDDKLSIKGNPATHMAKKYSRTENRRAIDDASAIIFTIERDEKAIENRETEISVQGGDEEEK